MFSFIPSPVARKGLLLLLALFALFHLLVLLGFIPYEVVWGGRSADRARLIKLELFSLALNLLMLLLVSAYTRIISLNINRYFLKSFLWFMAGFFLLNTLSNIFSLNSLEKAFFAPLTLLLALFSARLASAREEGETT